MLDSIHNFLIIAADEADSGPNLLLYIMPAFPIFMLWQFMYSPRKREEKKRSERINTLKKNDRIVTIGGITGTVASISEDHQFVTIKVEDNTRIKMLASSIQNVVGDETSGEPADAIKT